MLYKNWTLGPYHVGAQVLCALLVLTCSWPVHAAWRDGRADARGPASLRDTILLQPGTWSLAYRLELGLLGGLREGSSGLRREEAFAQGFSELPLGGRELTHRLSAHYGLNDRVVLGLHVPLRSLTTAYETSDASFEVDALGLGDIALGVLVDVLSLRGHRLHVSLMLSLPSGAIHVRGATPRDARERLGYQTRLGTGSFAVGPAVTYRGQSATMGWGVQLRARQPLDRNTDGYQVGGLYWLDAWWSYLPWSWLAGTVRLGGWRRSAISGQDADLAPARDPSHDPQRQAFWQIEAALGLDLRASGGSLEGGRVGVEAALPLVQVVEGPQLERDLALVVFAGWSF